MITLKPQKMKEANPHFRKDDLSGDLRSLLLRQKKILLKIRKGDHFRLDSITEMAYLRESNDHLRKELSDLTTILKRFIPSGVWT